MFIIIGSFSIIYNIPTVYSEASLISLEPRSVEIEALPSKGTTLSINVKFRVEDIEQLRVFTFKLFYGEEILEIHSHGGGDFGWGGSEGRHSYSQGGVYFLVRLKMVDILTAQEQFTALLLIQ